VGLLPTTTRAGHTLVGWFTAQTGGTQISTSTIVNGHTTYFARWNTINRTVTFNPNGGTVSTPTRTVATGNAVGTLPIPTRANHTFAGWFTDPNSGTQISANTIINNNITFFARWTANNVNVTVTFNANGGTVSPATRTVSSGARVGDLPTPQRISYTFVGWFTAQTGGTQINANTIVNSNATYFARWTATNVNFTVTFIAQGGSVSPATRSVRSGSAIGTLPEPTRAGHVFDGWFTQQIGGTRISASTIVSSNQTFFARWIATVTVTFNPNGGTLSAQSVRTVSAGTTWRAAVGALPVPTRSGHQFAGWYNAAAGGTRFLENTLINANITLFARWYVTVTFNGNGGIVASGEVSRRSVSGNAIGAMPGQPRRAGPTFGHRFDGWFTAPQGGSRVVPHATLVPNHNVTYYAQWRLHTDPSRHLPYWSFSTQITLRPTIIADTPLAITSGALWNQAINNAISGASSWNRSAAPVSFHQGASSNTVLAAPHIDRNYLGWVQPVTRGTELTRFAIVLNTRTIYTHAERWDIPLSNLITSVMVHELGHTIGLADNPGTHANNSIMNQNRNRGIVISPTAFDVLSVQLIYN